MFSEDLLEQARQTLDEARAGGVCMCTAESCTGGLISALLTEIPGSSDVVERGFVTYSNRAKQEMLGVPQVVLERYGAVSRQTALEMAKGALTHADVHIAVAVTGIAGPGGGTAQKPVGLVYIATARVSAPGAPPLVVERECNFGARSRTEIRLLTVVESLSMLRGEVKKYISARA